jgi:AhpC/TSA family protein
VPSADLPGAAARRALLALAAATPLALAGCGGTLDDLFPSGADHSGGAAGTTGPAVGQVAPDFALPDTLGGAATLSGLVATHRAAVLYFVMWCPICDAHLSHMLDADVPAFPDVAFVAIDYVSGSVAQARQSQLDAGWGGDAFLVLADVGAVVERTYSRPMGVVVVDRDRVVRMNEEFDGARLHALLEALP